MINVPPKSILGVNMNIAMSTASISSLHIIANTNPANKIVYLIKLLVKGVVD